MKLFWFFYFVGKQVYKLEIFKNLKIHDIFYMSLLKKENIKKRWVDKNITKLDFEVGGNSKEYKEETIWNSTIYIKKLEFGY